MGYDKQKNVKCNAMSVFKCMYVHVALSDFIPQFYYVNNTIIQIHNNNNTLTGAVAVFYLLNNYILLFGTIQ